MNTMARENELHVDSELAFFGKMSASISHDLKNCLAIINENAGLLEDLSLGAHRGIPLDPNHLQVLSEKVKKQVRRANSILTYMNRFAHSIDKSTQDVDLVDSIELMSALGERFAALQNVTLQAQLPDHAVKVFSAPYLLNHIIWLCLEAAIEAIGGNRTLLLTIDKTKDGAIVVFKPLKIVPGETVGLLNRQAEADGILKILGATVKAGATGEELILTIPYTMFS
jgi:C4-dicarboxylate-specific signal transduction histidine kinase